MSSARTFCIYLVELWLVLAFVIFRPSTCSIDVTVHSIEAYSALLQWELVCPENTSVTSFHILVQGSVTTKMEETVAGNVTSHRLKNLDDMRSYNACVTTVACGNSETGCSNFTTPPGTSTYIAIASGVFLVLCFVVFGILDFWIGSKRKKMLSHKEEQLLEQGWQTFKRNSKKKEKGKKRAAPKQPRPDSTVEPGARDAH